MKLMMSTKSFGIWLTLWMMFIGYIGRHNNLLLDVKNDFGNGQVWCFQCVVHFLFEQNQRNTGILKNFILPSWKNFVDSDHCQKWLYLFESLCSFTSDVTFCPLMCQTDPEEIFWKYEKIQNQQTKKMLSHFLPKMTQNPQI